MVSCRFVRLKELLNVHRGEIHRIENIEKGQTLLKTKDNLGNEIGVLLFCLLPFAERPSTPIFRGSEHHHHPQH